METVQETSQEPEFRPVPLLELRAAYIHREQERVTRMLRRDKLNNWIAGLVILLVGGVAATLLMISKPSSTGSTGTYDVRKGR